MGEGIHPTAQVHPSAIVDDGARVGARTRIWHFCHVSAGAVIGDDCSFGQNCYVAPSARVGNRVKVQNNVSLFDGVELEDEVFCGPSAVFTNVVNPRSAVPRRDEYRPTLVRRGATIGANATILCGTTLEPHSFVAAGAVVTQDVAAYRLVGGVPARPMGFMSRAGGRLEFDRAARARCDIDGSEYRLEGGRVVADD